MVKNVSEAEIADFLAWLNAFSEKENVSFTVSMTLDPETVSEEIKKYVI